MENANKKIKLLLICFQLNILDILLSFFFIGQSLFLIEECDMTWKYNFIQIRLLFMKNELTQVIFALHQEIL